MFEADREQQVRAWQTAHAQLLAAAAANDPAKVAAAADALAAVRAAAGELGFYQQEKATFAGACTIATELLALGEVGPARRVLAAFELADVEHGVLRAIDEEDPELAFVQLGALPETGLTPSTPPHWALIREVVAQVAKALAGVGSKEHALLGVAAFTRATYGEYEEYALGVDRAEAWAKALHLAVDEQAQAFAIARMCSRRSAGERAALFIECAADLVSAPAIPGLIEELARHARTALDQRYRRGRLRQVARDAILHGRRDELDARLGALVANRRGRHDPAVELREAESDLRGLLSRGQATLTPMLGVGDRADGAPSAVITWQVETGLLALLDQGAEPFGYAQLRLDGARVGRWRAERILSAAGIPLLVACHESARRSANQADWTRHSGLVETRSGQLALVDRIHRVDDALRLGAGALVEVPEGFWSEIFVAYEGPLIVGVGVAFAKTDDAA